MSENVFNLADALAAIKSNEAVFVSRGDNSGTHKKELSLWKAAQLPGRSLIWTKCLKSTMRFVELILMAVQGRIKCLNLILATWLKN